MQYDYNFLFSSLPYESGSTRLMRRRRVSVTQKTMLSRLAFSFRASARRSRVCLCPGTIIVGGRSDCVRVGRSEQLGLSVAIKEDNVTRDVPGRVSRNYTV